MVLGAQESVTPGNGPEPETLKVDCLDKCVVLSRTLSCSEMVS